MFDEFLTQLTLLAIASPGKKSRKKLVAEIGAAFLCADLGITPETRDDHAAYIASWLPEPIAPSSKADPTI
jgi:antirestriction protein ArdC